ncbi:MAG: hypothetical protein ABL958_06155 [Bdellovibrionia bacterium]
MKTIRYVTVALLFSFSAWAGEEIDVPINIGLGPATHYFNETVVPDQPSIYGLKLHLGAVIDHELIEKNKDKIPENIRGTVTSIDEAIIGHILVPDTIFVSPKANGLGVYGLSWQPLKPGLGMTFGFTRISLGMPLKFTVLRVERELLESFWFVRPAVGLELKADFKFSKYFVLTLGGGRDWYWNQKTPEDRMVWGIDHAYALFNYRHPFRTELK